ncbi:hypothetical protein ACHAXA_004541, partial [Cyclostephanos tholiformis]
GETSPGSPVAKSYRDKSPPSSAIDPTPTQQPRHGTTGLLSPFFASRSSNGSDIGCLATNAASSFESPSSPKIASRDQRQQQQQQQQQRSFLGGLLSATVPNAEVPSPGTIRRSASALLRKSTGAVPPPPPPPLPHAVVPPDPVDDGIAASPTSRVRGGHDDDGDDGDDGSSSLESRLRRRDEELSHLRDELRAHRSQLAKMARDDHALRRGLLESTHRHAVAVKLWRRTNDGLRARVTCFECETTPDAAVEIANLIRDAAPSNKDSSYLMMLRDQLDRASSKLEHLRSQTEIVLHKGEEVVESLREEMNEVIRERCRMEIELLDQARMLEDDMSRMADRTERRLRRVQGEIDYLEKNAMEVLKTQDEGGGAGGGGNEKGAGDGVDGGDDEDDLETSSDHECAKEEGRGGNGVDGVDGRHERDVGVTDETEGESGKSPEDQVDARDGTAASEENDGEGPKEAQHTPEGLRKELRTLAMERDRTLSVLRKKLREKNDEFHNLMRYRDGRLKAISKMEAEKRDREEWARSRRGDVDETFLTT